MAARCLDTLHDFCHVHRDGPGGNAEFPGAGDDPGHAGAPDLILAGQAVDVRAGPAYPAPFNHRDLLAGLREVPGKVFATLATTDDDCIILFGSGHRDLHNQAPTAGRNLVSGHSENAFHIEDGARERPNTRQPDSSRHVYTKRAGCE